MTLKNKIDEVPLPTQFQIFQAREAIERIRVARAILANIVEKARGTAKQSRQNLARLDKGFYRR